MDRSRRSTNLETIMIMVLLKKVLKNGIILKDI